MSNIRIIAVAVLAGIVARPALAAARPAALTVAGTEVSFKNRKTKRAAEVGEALRRASTEEAHYYDAAQRPVVMRVRIDAIGFKSAGKAIAGNLPLVGMFTGENRNMIRGQVFLIDQASGRQIRKFKIEADDDTDMSAGDAAMIYGKVGLSFLPFGQLISAAVDVGEGAANKRDRAEEMLTRGFVMLSYRKAYGDKLYRSFSTQRKAAFELAKAGKAPAAAVPAVAGPSGTEQAVAAAATPAAS